MPTSESAKLDGKTADYRVPSTFALSQPTGKGRRPDLHCIGYVEYVLLKLAVLSYKHKKNQHCTETFICFHLQEILILCPISARIKKQKRLIKFV
ncbi:hypothetical protein GWI33_021738 [Rhynchophorus ferrugineus]|uniref:Uncharacterized protein n=1 Tax=Rhynchophorus ferrugineus TaxID=354439 RepID=A0A834MMW7_RHYFE|nr:hypothetical protein GWI33_021738 [Rhynchophorus ferrugineus]